MVMSSFPPKNYYTRTCTGGLTEREERWGGGECRHCRDTGGQTKRETGEEREAFHRLIKRLLQNNIGVSRVLPKYYNSVAYM